MSKASLDCLHRDHGCFRFPDDRVEPVVDRFVACPVAQHDAVKFMENPGIDMDRLAGKALQQIDGSHFFYPVENHPPRPHKGR
jgi:hypothetical protein